MLAGTQDLENPFAFNLFLESPQGPFERLIISYQYLGHKWPYYTPSSDEINVCMRAEFANFRTGGKLNMKTQMAETAKEEK